MKKLLALGVAAIAINASAQALEIDFGGSVKFKYSDITNNRADADSVGTTLCGALPLLGDLDADGDDGGKTFCENSDGFSTSVDFDVDIRGSNELFPEYGADINWNQSGRVDESELWAITGIGRFGIGDMKTSNRSADRISVGESGVSTEPLGKEYHDVFGGIGVSFATRLGPVTGAINLTEKAEATWHLQYDGETEAFDYEVYVRGGSRGEVFTGPLKAVDSYETLQYGALVTFGDFKVAASAGSEEGENYAGVGNAVPGVLSQDVSREYMNVGVSYSMDALSVSADYDTGSVNAPWTLPGAPPPLSALNGSGAYNYGQGHSDREWDAYSVGVSYKVADGLTLGLGYSVYENLPVLNLDPDTNASLVTTGTTGLTLKKQSEVAASIKLAF